MGDDYTDISYEFCKKKRLKKFGKPIILFGVKIVESPKGNGQYLAVMDKNVFNETSVSFMRKNRMQIYLVMANCTDDGIAATLSSTVDMKLLQVVPDTGDKIILLVQLSKPLPDFKGAAQKAIDNYRKEEQC